MVVSVVKEEQQWKGNMSTQSTDLQQYQCNVCHDMVNERGRKRHEMYHQLLEVDKSLQLNDRAQQQLSDDLGDGPDASTTALVIRRVARRLCVLENLLSLIHI